MFDFFSMADNYEERKVECFDGDGFTVDTSRVTDSDQPYETGIKHSRYNEEKWVIVEMYDDVEEAKTGHAKWVKLMTGETLPATLKDVSTSEIQKLLDIL